MVALLQKRWPPAAEVSINGEPVSVIVKVSTRSRSYRLSLPHGGKPTLTARTEANLQIRMPFPPSPLPGSIYENQLGTKHRFFEFKPEMGLETATQPA